MVSPTFVILMTYVAFKTTFKYNVFSAGEAIVTGAGDETLRFWNDFSKARSQKVLSLMFFSTW